jgi:hypothetical protein
MALSAASQHTGGRSRATHARSHPNALARTKAIGSKWRSDVPHPAAALLGLFDLWKKQRIFRRRHFTVFVPAQ